MTSCSRPHVASLVNHFCAVTLEALAQHVVTRAGGSTVVGNMDSVSAGLTMCWYLLGTGGPRRRGTLVSGTGVPMRESWGVSPVSFLEVQYLAEEAGARIRLLARSSSYPPTRTLERCTLRHVARQ